MSAKCYVPNCLSGHPNNSVKRQFFGVPSDPERREQWRKMIPRDVPAIHKTARVCELHFEEADLIKGNTYIIEGEKILLPMKWKLKEGALPRIFPDCPSYLNKPSKRRKSPIDRSEKRSKVEDTALHEESQQEDELIVQDHCSDINLAAVRLPSLSWCWLSHEDGSSSKDGFARCAEIVADGDSKTYPRRSVKFNLKLGTAIYFVSGLLLKSLPSSWKTTFCSEDDMSDLLRSFHSTKLCPGFPASLFPGICMSPLSGFNIAQVWRSSKCSGISQHPYKPCHDCRTLKHTMQRKKLRINNK